MIARCPVFKPWQLKVMQRAIRDSVLEGREYGFSFDADYQTGAVEDLNEYCRGEACSVEIPDMLDHNSSFHVHPVIHGDRQAAVYPSSSDLKHGARNDLYFECVGGVEDHSFEDRSDKYGLNIYRAGPFHDETQMVVRCVRIRTFDEAVNSATKAGRPYTTLLDRIAHGEECTWSWPYKGPKPWMKPLKDDLSWE